MKVVEQRIYTKEFTKQLPVIHIAAKPERQNFWRAETEKNTFLACKLTEKT